MKTPPPIPLILPTRETRTPPTKYNTESEIKTHNPKPEAAHAFKLRC